MLVGATLLGMAEGDPQRWAQIAALTALIFAAMSVIAWALSLSSLVNFISETILLGFKAGAALTIGLTQLPQLFGVPGGGDHFFERLWTLGAQLPDTNLAVLAFGLAAIVLLVAGERFCLGGRWRSSWWLPRSLPCRSRRSRNSDSRRWAYSRPACPISRCRRFGPATRMASYRSPSRASCLPTSKAYPPPGPSRRNTATRSLRGRSCWRWAPRMRQRRWARAIRSPAWPAVDRQRQRRRKDALALVFASATIGLCLVYLTGLLTNLPNVILAAIVLVAIKSLINIPELLRTWKLSRMEFWVAIAAFAGVLLLGILKGVLLAAVVSILLLIRRVANPHVARLGRVPGTDRYSDCERNPGNETVRGVLVVRVEASLLYFNTSTFAIACVYSSRTRAMRCDSSCGTSRLRPT
jgi:hypothetical protein